MKHQEELETLLLETLSLFDYFSLERVFLEFDQDKILNYPEFNRTDLEELLELLTINKTLSRKSINGECHWKKKFPQRKSFIKRVFSQITG